MVAALFIVFLVLLFLGLPIAFCLGISSLAYLWMAGIPLMVRPVQAAMRGELTRLMELSAVLGKGLPTTFVRVVLPH